MYRQYDEEILKRIKETEKEILLKFVAICEKHNLNYFVVFGTLLGTIRHGGFIPWDDDIDVGMLRKDYEKFLEVAQQECGEEFFLQTIDTDSNYHLYFAKLRKRDSIFIENSLQKADSTSGFYIDIFPYDMVSDYERQMKWQIRLAVLLGMLLSINRTEEPQIGNYGKLKKVILKVIWKVAHYGMKMLGISAHFIEKRFIKVSTKYNGKRCDRYITFSAQAEKWIICREELETLLTKKFENINVLVPQGYDSILKRCYGDYRALPPEEKRVNHMPVKIKFPGEDEVIILKGNE